MLLDDADCLRLAPDAPCLSPAARALLAAAPSHAVRAAGRLDLLSLPLVGLFSSGGGPPALAAPARRVARELREGGIAAVGGFHAPLERDLLGELLRGDQPVVACPARALPGMRLSAARAARVRAGRLLLLGVAPEGRRRPTARTADLRNRVAAALAARLFVAYAAPAGAVYRLAREALARGQAVLCLDHRANRDLVLMGARPVEGWGDVIPAGPAAR